ncbi:hypothetical protein CLAFUW4_09711 [Fulvia fulva]|uniref:F-box domain-containing protein n=1 Tax=Passalora fulva TaxID=5499 RepID=A0A9Q8PFW4_PASFU|nr:uncharacterized protein CLAFUR5_09804 [Fulvia fulva]KAK4613631.1 hypothetical protein CLAFUR4_09716 [Fulvia fulva]KAK4615272.1 hypothetical protein CLAFUR0_09707 [Fulvia fulva]UJO21733.1 hypothetical protein CLAFUR5_09804 [Fulvia fulva]WPV20752.1 hypothetical protein CLAFUW4_09711 [Fulvia fulva]WPV35330.1 hypothetical protein CLAFUW7_09712 [Fulvia fulva]
MAPSLGDQTAQQEPQQIPQQTANMYAAAHAVFYTTELLEQILLELPMKDLLLDQRVSKMWKECIDKSTKLQKALFFVADADE